MKTSSLAEEGGSERQSIQVISRAASLLRALQDHPDGLSLGELAKRVALPRSTVQRIVDALDREGLVSAASASRGVRLGPALLALAAATRFHLAELARDTLEDIAKACLETVDLSILDHDKAVFIDQVTGSQRLTAVSAVGVAFPLHACANGKAMLAAMSREEFSRVRKQLPLGANTTATIVSLEQLETELDSIRALGVAYDHDEHAEGISAVARAMRSPSGELFAVSIPVPSQRFRKNEKGLTDLLLEHTRRLEEKLRG